MPDHETRSMDAYVTECYGYNYVPGTNNGTPGMNNGGTPRTNNDAPETNNDDRDFWRGCDRGRNDLND